MAVILAIAAGFAASLRLLIEEGFPIARQERPTMDRPKHGTYAADTAAHHGERRAGELRKGCAYQSVSDGSDLVSSTP